MEAGANDIVPAEADEEGVPSTSYKVLQADRRLCALEVSLCTRLQARSEGASVSTAACDVFRFSRRSRTLQPCCPA